MKYALVDGIKQEPFPNQKGICCLCGSPTSSKCGNSKVWHWAHKSLRKCDPWWENETAWHRLWKSYFNKDNQEVIHFDENTGEKHIADIKTNNGMVIEIQNSPINEDELRSRENFYGNMIWIINGEKFKNNFHISEKLPRPNLNFFEDIIFHPGGITYHKESDDPKYYEDIKSAKRYFHMIEAHFMSDIKEEIENNYIGHHLFDCKHKRGAWFNATKPVFIDFGDNHLWLLEKYYKEEYKSLWSVQKISKDELILKNGGGINKNR
ncbi:MAG: hypothetical protein KME38_20525 [Spirirestis rafaelensis WJT71-NPBG6]|nr:hypothetical protein [Spirirestis rafaelensis WJT71-NPBG6]